MNSNIYNQFLIYITKSRKIEFIILKYVIRSGIYLDLITLQKKYKNLEVLKCF